jgi:hypothetical protein
LNVPYLPPEVSALSSAAAVSAALEEIDKANFSHSQTIYIHDMD